LAFLGLALALSRTTPPSIRSAMPCVMQHATFLRVRARIRPKVWREMTRRCSDFIHFSEVVTKLTASPTCRMWTDHLFRKAKMKPDCITLLLALIPALTAFQHVAASEALLLTDRNGATLSAKPLSCDGKTLTIIRDTDRKKFSIPLERLDAASQDRVQTWMAKAALEPRDFEITVVTNKNSRKTGMEDFDDKRVNLDPVVTIRNPEPRVSSPAAKVSVLFLGRPVSDPSGFVIIRKSTFDLPDLGPHESEEFKVGKISLAYDNRGYAQFGARYCGYVILIHDTDAERIIDSTSVPAGLDEKFGLRFLQLKTNVAYNRDLR
jgi:hypothetical protein